jgi:Flp pilus assembly pilin Flp
MHPPTVLLLVGTIAAQRLRVVLRGLRTRDEGAPALEYIILAALILVAVVAMATYVVSRIVNYQNQLP